jgi:hypothetical protein
VAKHILEQDKSRAVVAQVYVLCSKALH